jgi:pimeloyl-ACP methyl ester carboxylesterase
VNELDVLTGPRGLRLRVCRWGPEHGRPVLILHGFLEQGAAWHEVATRLARPVHAPDHRGHGLSDHVPAGGFYHFWDYVADADQLVDALGGVVDLVGHSMGGAVATLLAATRPEKVRRLVLVEGLGPPDLRALTLPRAAAFLDARTRPPQHPSFATVEEATARMRDVNPRLPVEAAERLARRVLRPVQPGDPLVRPPHHEGWWTWTWDPLHRARTPNPFDADLHTTCLAAVKAPTLLIDGADSAFRLDLADHRRRAEALREREEIEVPDAGHLLHHDAPEALASLITAFFDR